MEKYLGSLPKGKKALKWVDTKERVQQGRIEDIFAVDMQTPKSSVIQTYSAYLPYTAERKAALDAASYILDIRWDRRSVLVRNSAYVYCWPPSTYWKAIRFA